MMNRAGLSTSVIRSYNRHSGTVSELPDTRKLADLKVASGAALLTGAARLGYCRCARLESALGWV
jgi:hypothetical protein